MVIRINLGFDVTIIYLKVWTFSAVGSALKTFNRGGAMDAKFAENCQCLMIAGAHGRGVLANLVASRPGGKAFKIVQFHLFNIVILKIKL